MAGSDGEIDGTNSGSKDARATKAFDRTGWDCSPGPEVGAFRRDVDSGPSVEDEGRFIEIDRKRAPSSISRGGFDGLEKINGA